MSQHSRKSMCEPDAPAKETVMPRRYDCPRRVRVDTAKARHFVFPRWRVGLAFTAYGPPLTAGPSSQRGERGSRLHPFVSLARILIAVLAISSPLPAAEVTSAGNGDWTDPATWHGNKIPEPGDDVFIRKFDVVSYNRPGDDRPACQKLQIDPKGVLQFKAGSGKCVFIAQDVIDCYGVIKIDANKNATDFFELRLGGKTPAQRAIKLEKGAGLLMYGKTGLGEGKRNVGLSAAFGKDEKEPPAALVEIVGQGSIDIQ